MLHALSSVVSGSSKKKRRRKNGCRELGMEWGWSLGCRDNLIAWVMGESVWKQPCMWARCGRISAFFFFFSFLLRRFCPVKREGFFFSLSLTDQNKITRSCPAVLFFVGVPATSDHTRRFGPAAFLREDVRLPAAGKRGASTYVSGGPGSTRLSLVLTRRRRNLGATFPQRAGACVRSWARFLEESQCWLRMTRRRKSSEIFGKTQKPNRKTVLQY